MIPIHLSPAEETHLQNVFAQATDPKLRDRVQMVLMAHRQRPRPQSAIDLGVTPRTVQRHLKRYWRHGLAGLPPRQAPGAKAKIPEALVPQLRQWVLDGPVACGLDRANGTFQELADHLHRVQGIRVGRSTMHALGQRHGIRPYRPTYRFLRADPQQQAQAAQELAALKKGRPPAS